jgi:hypothetical protein
VSRKPIAWSDTRIDNLDSAPTRLVADAAYALAENAPTLVYGVNVGDKVVLVLPNPAVPVLAALAAFCEAYDDDVKPKAKRAKARRM